MGESKLCPLKEINLTNIQLSDKAGVKLLSSLSVGLGKKMAGYEKITSLALANNELGPATGHLLKEVLWGERSGGCTLRYLDLSSNVDLHGGDIALAIRRNESLTSLDIRNIPSANTDSVFTSIGNLLLQEDCQCRLGFLSCDAFQVTAEQEALTLLGEDEAWEIPAGNVSGAHFEMLGVGPALGRTLTREDQRPGAEPVVVLSHGLWQSRFGGDPGILGRTVALAEGRRSTRTVVGVMPAGHRPLEPSWQAWVPWRRDPSDEEAWSHMYGLRLHARLAPG